MKKEKSYNGWSNWETWNAYNWISSDPFCYKNWFDCIESLKKSHYTTWSITRYFEQRIDEENRFFVPNGLFEDFYTMKALYSDINVYELVNAFLES